MAEGDYPILALPAGEVVPLVKKTGGGGGPRNPTKARQIERLDPQFLELQRVLEARRADLSTSALGAGPEHVLVFETNGPPDDFFAEVAQRPELEWLLDYEERVPADGDFKPARERKNPLPPNATQTLPQYVYMVLFNQTALEQLLSYWATYKDSETMPAGLGAWSGVFRCLRAIRRWGQQDRLREAQLLQDVLNSIDHRNVGWIADGESPASPGSPHSGRSGWLGRHLPGRRSQTRHRHGLADSPRGE
jgi:hypothetical protein